MRLHFPRQEDYSERGWGVFIHMNVFYLLTTQMFGNSRELAEIERHCRMEAEMDGVIMMDEFLGIFYLVMSRYDFELHRLLRRTATLMLMQN